MITKGTAPRPASRRRQDFRTTWATCGDIEADLEGGRGPGPGGCRSININSFNENDDGMGVVFVVNFSTAG